MSWYYVEQNEQRGPADQAQLERLVQQGVITGATLVWREGMANWQPYSLVVVGTPPAPSSAGGAASTLVVCSECGQAFSPNDVIRLGNSYVCALCKPVATQKLREGVLSHSEEIRQEHIKHEASVKSIGVLYFLGAGFLVLFAIAVFMPATARGAAASGAFLSVVFLALAAVQTWVGIGVRALKGWARIAAGILSGIGLLGFPLGTLINAYILYLLFSKKGTMVFSDEYKQVIQETPHIKYRTSIVVWICLGVLLLLIFLGVFAAVFAGARR